MHPSFRKLEMPLMFIIGLTMGFLIWGKDDIQAALAQLSLPGEDRYTELDLTGRPVLGPDDAPVTLIEFADYQCPYCQAWQAEVLPLIRQQYRDQVRIFFIDFPLSTIHEQAFVAAEAAHCAGAQGQYWPFHDALFAHQEALNQDLYFSLAGELGLDPEAIAACLEAGTYATRVKQGVQMAQDFGFMGTPAFLINGKRIVGAQPFDVFKQIIDEELGQ